jgi:hypothetical protein
MAQILNAPYQIQSSLMATKWKNHVKIKSKEMNLPNQSSSGIQSE